MKKILCLVLLTGSAWASEPPALTLGRCLDAAATHSPLLEQQRLSTQKWQMKSRAAGSALLPQLSLNAQATYQNEVPALPEGTPMAGLLSLPKDQYYATMNLEQVVYGGSSVRNTRRLNDASADVENLSLEVRLDRLRDRVSGLFFGALLLERQLDVNGLMQITLDGDLREAEARVKKGTLTQGALLSLEARKLELQQQRVDLETTRAILLQDLSTLTGMETSGSQLVPPPVDEFAVPDPQVVGAPTELKLFDAQRHQLDRQGQLLNSKANPKFSLFATGGWGLPGYNFFDVDGNLMGMAGARLSIPLTGWDAVSKDKRALRLQSSEVDQQRRDFLRENDLQVTRCAQQIGKCQNLVLLDSQIVLARSEVRRRAAAQLKEGTITQADYIAEFNNELTARVQMQARQIEFIQAWVDYYAALGQYQTEK